MEQRRLFIWTASHINSEDDLLNLFQCIESVRRQPEVAQHIISLSARDFTLLHRAIGALSHSCPIQLHVHTKPRPVFAHFEHIAYMARLNRDIAANDMIMILDGHDMLLNVPTGWRRVRAIAGSQYLSRGVADEITARYDVDQARRHVRDYPDDFEDVEDISGLALPFGRFCEFLDEPPHDPELAQPVDGNKWHPLSDYDLMRYAEKHARKKILLSVPFVFQRKGRAIAARISADDPVVLSRIREYLVVALAKTHI